MAATEIVPETPELTGTGMLSIRVPASLLAELKQEAQEAGVTLTAWVIDSLTWRSDNEAVAAAEPAVAVEPTGTVLDVEPHQILVQSGCGRSYEFTDYAGVESRLKDQLDPHKRPADQRPGATLIVTG